MAALTKTWQEALGLCAHTKIVEKPQMIPPNVLIFTLQDPAGQRFTLRIVAATQLGLNGNLVVANSGFNIEAMTEESN